MNLHSAIGGFATYENPALVRVSSSFLSLRRSFSWETKLVMKLVTESSMALRTCGAWSRFQLRKAG